MAEQLNYFKYIVAKGGSILAGALHLQAGQEVPPGALPASALAEHVKSGYVIVQDLRKLVQDVEAAVGVPGVKPTAPVGDVDAPNGRVVVGKVEPVAVKRAPPVPQLVVSEPPADPTSTQVGMPGEGAQTPPPANPQSPAPVINGVWVFNPATLQDKSLEVLNAMIVERDGKIAPMDTKEEAIAQLSSEYKD